MSVEMTVQKIGTDLRLAQRFQHRNVVNIECWSGDCSSRSNEVAQMFLKASNNLNYNNTYKV